MLINEDNEPESWRAYAALRVCRDRIASMLPNGSEVSQTFTVFEQLQLNRALRELDRVHECLLKRLTT